MTRNEFPLAQEVRSPSSSMWRKLFLVVASTVLALGLCEIGLRVLMTTEGILRLDNDEDWWQYRWLQDRRNIRSDAQLTTLNPLVIYSPTLGWRLRPNFREGDFSLNSRGVRGAREYPYEKPTGERRILVMGDSFTFGVRPNESLPRVSDAEIYTALLEKAVPGVSVINLGVPGYGAGQQLLYLREEGFRYHPDLVIVSLFVDNLRRTTLYFRDYGKPDFEMIGGKLVIRGIPIPPPEALEKVAKPHVPPSYLWTVVQSLFDRLAAARAPLGMLEVDQVNEAVLDTMRAEVREHGARLLIVVIPHSAYPAPWDRSEKFLRDLGARTETPVLMLRDTFLALPAEARAKVYAGHWTPFGHRVAAQAILNEILKLKLLGEIQTLPAIFAGSGPN